jgi:hypothetical protein
MSTQSALLPHSFRALGAVALLEIEAALPGKHSAGLGSYGRVGSKLTPRGSESECEFARTPVLPEATPARALSAHSGWRRVSDQIPSAANSGHIVRYMRISEPMVQSVARMSWLWAVK